MEIPRVSPPSLRKSLAGILAMELLLRGKTPSRPVFITGTRPGRWLRDFWAVVKRPPVVWPHRGASAPRTPTLPAE